MTRTRSISAIPRFLRLTSAALFATATAIASEAAPLAWKTWQEVARPKSSGGDRPIYAFLGSDLSELSRSTEQQSFGRPETAAWLATQFVCVRIDETTEPAIAAFVRDLVERVRQQKGPPYHVWFTPQLEPYETAGYLPPSEEWSQPGFLKTARGALEAWRDHRSTVTAAVRELRESARPEVPSERLPSVSTLLARGAEAWLAAEDVMHSGFGQAPKEPNPEAIRFLLTQGPAAKDAALRAARAIVDGALQDPQDGGFFRRTIDEAWREPYRQKHLLDQARIAYALMEAADSGGEPTWTEAAHRALRFALNRLKSPGGGFLAALDETENRPARSISGTASLAAQGFFLTALQRAGEPFANDAKDLARHLIVSTTLPIPLAPSPRGRFTPLATDLIAVASSLSDSPRAEDRRHAKALVTIGLDEFWDDSSGRFWAVSAPSSSTLPWRPHAPISPVRAESLALTLVDSPATVERMRRALQYAIEFDPLPPADILLALAATNERIP